ncbi:hypothetical protein [Fructilactobacillus florum]|uniref:hypothetical protein n=1 Tax=Fructilactobacillus florum TaxID=640331 RepID=UPI00070563A2|nr:hypothetical protein [Fructilactobacillus florum]
MSKVILSKELAFEAKSIGEGLPKNSLTRKDVELSFGITVKCLKDQLGDNTYMLNTRQHLDEVISNKEILINAVLNGYEVEKDE